jgi:site-specific recombinase XerD
MMSDGLVRVIGKGSKERLVVGRQVIGAVSVPLNDPARLDRGKSEGRLLLSARGQPLSQWGSGAW